jgi:hypothetical protein
LARDGRPFLRTVLTADRVLAPGWRVGIESGILSRNWAYYGRKAQGDERSITLSVVHTSKERERIEIGMGYEKADRELREEGTRGHPLKLEQELDIDLQAELKLGAALRNRIKVQGVRALGEETPAALLIAYDLIRTWEGLDLKLYGRLAYFDAPAYSTRPYAYENDLLYAFSVNAYYRTGMRGYLLLRYGIAPDLTVEGKIGSWAFRAPENGRIGSGDRAIPGRYRSRVRLQLRGSF